MFCPITVVTRVHQFFSYSAYISSGLVSAHYGQSRNIRLGLVLSTYVESVTISNNWEAKQPAVIGPGSKQPAEDEREDTCGCPHVLIHFCFLGHLSATLFPNNISLLSNKCALPLLCADLVHLSGISFHTIVPVFCQILSLACDQYTASAPMFF